MGVKVTKPKPKLFLTLYSDEDLPKYYRISEEDGSFFCCVHAEKFNKYLGLTKNLSNRTAISITIKPTKKVTKDDSTRID